MTAVTVGGAGVTVGTHGTPTVTARFGARLGFRHVVTVVTVVTVVPISIMAKRIDPAAGACSRPLYC